MCSRVDSGSLWAGDGVAALSSVRWLSSQNKSHHGFPAFMFQSVLLYLGRKTLFVIFKN